MRWRTPVMAALTACLTLAAPAGSQAPSPGVDILKRVERTYEGLQRYLFEGVIKVEVRSTQSPQLQEAPFFVAVDGRGRIRDQVTSGASGGMILSDGRQTYIYNAQLGQYTRTAGNADSVLAKVPNRGVGGTLVGRYARVTTGISSTKRLPNEILNIDGVKYDCTVIEATYAPGTHRSKITEEPRLFWIDTRTHLVLRQRSIARAEAPQLGGKVEQEETITFKRASIDPVLPESLWVFRAPAGSREVAQFEMTEAHPAAEFAGKPAIDFTLKDLKGRAHSLKSLRGKTVLIDFWATWCGPCRITMPQVAKIHTEYKNRGVEVLSINVGESAAKAGDYLKKNGYTFTSLLDEDRTVSTRYKINGIPTLVVIDPSGKVTDYLVGARDDVALRAALKKAGVK
jgi:thiol-disulfide isomerase/thioredoxin